MSVWNRIWNDSYSLMTSSVKQGGFLDDSQEPPSWPSVLGNIVLGSTSSSSSSNSNNNNNNTFVNRTHMEGAALTVHLPRLGRTTRVTKTHKSSSSTTSTVSSCLANAALYASLICFTVGFTYLVQKARQYLSRVEQQQQQQQSSRRRRRHL